MTKTKQMQIRLEPELKTKAEEPFSQGLQADQKPGLGYSKG